MADDRIDERLEELNADAPTEPRPAAGVILMRHGGKHSSEGMEVLLGRRTSAARFMADVWVFPGGAVDGTEDDDRAHRQTALRELEEEAGVALEGPETLVPFSRWITPTQVKIRYDTRFYLAQAAPHTTPEPDGEEIVEIGWFAPGDALARHREGNLLLVFPTIKMLETLARFGSPEEALETVGGSRSSRSCRASTRPARSRGSSCRATRTTEYVRSGRRQPIEEEPEPQLGLAREAVGLGVLDGVHDHLAALERRRHQIVDQERDALGLSEGALGRPRHVVGEQERRGAVAASVADHKRQRAAGLPLSHTSDHVRGGRREHDCRASNAGCFRRQRPEYTRRDDHHSAP